MEDCLFIPDHDIEITWFRHGVHFRIDKGKVLLIQCKAQGL